MASIGDNKGGVKIGGKMKLLFGCFLIFVFLAWPFLLMIIHITMKVKGQNCNHSFSVYC